MRARCSVVILVIAAPPACRLCQRRRDLAQQQLDDRGELAHGALHAEQQAIIRMPRIIDTVLVYDDRPDKSTELDQRVPVAAITGKTRRLDREHSADTAVADRY